MAQSITEMLDTLYAVTWARRRAGVADNIFDSTPFWYFLKEKGGLVQETGGKRIEVNLRTGKSPNVGWIGKGGSTGMGDMDHLEVAYYPWRYLVDSIVRFFVDEQQNRGKARIINLMNSKIDTAQDTLVEELETRLFGSASGLEMLGLLDLVQDDPTSVQSIGNIPQSTNSWWRNQQINMTGNPFTNDGVKAMRQLLNSCVNNMGMDRPNIIVSGEGPYEYYEEEGLERMRIVNKMMADVGFTSVEFKGIPMVWSPYCDSTRMYFLNTKFINFIYDPGFMFEMTDWKMIPNQVNDRAAQIITACNFITNRRRCHGVLHHIPDAQIS